MNDTAPKISIVVPIHDMKNGAFFLWRVINSIMEQTLKDYEIVIVKEGLMAENTNAGIRKAKGELVKILYLDDYFAHPNALQDIVDNFEGEWMITGVDTNPNPYWTNDIFVGNNHLGSPSALTMRKATALLFDERLSWLLDCELYWRMYKKNGSPKILNGVNVNIGVHDGQMTGLMSEDYKYKEQELVKKLYE